MIFGSDDRSTLSITDTPDTAHSSIVKLACYYSDGSVFTGSGTIIGANDVLTAGHMVYDTNKKMYPDYIEITPYMFGDTKPYGVTYAYNFFTPTEWSQNQDYAYDYALLTMDRAIGYYTGWSNLNKMSSAAEYSGYVTTYGYPGDIQNGTCPISTTGSNGSLTDGIIRYTNLDARAGQSGSGVFLNGDYSKLIGVVSHENYVPNYNGVAPVTTSAYSQIMNWAAQNDSDLATRPLADPSLQGIVNELSLFYLGYLGRMPEKTGLDYWINSYKSGTNLLEISKQFFASPEYASLSSSTSDVKTFVEQLYQTTFGRDADKSGLDFWSNAILNGADRSTVAFGFILSDEYAKKNALNLYQVWHREYNDFTLEAHGDSTAETLIASNLGDSMLYGAEDNDVLNGGAYNDYLWGGAENDTLTGSKGADFFAWDVGEGVDMVADFDYSQDFIRLRSSFAWEWSTSSDEWLSLKPTTGSGGLILNGISPSLAEHITVV